MSAIANNFWTFSRRGLACFWVLTGVWLVFLFVRDYEGFDLAEAIALTIGLAFMVSGGGLFFNQRWGRISIRCLMVIVMLWAADMLLFIAFRGLSSGRLMLLGIVLAFIFAAIFTWSVLTATAKETRIVLPENTPRA